MFFMGIGMVVYSVTMRALAQWRLGERGGKGTRVRVNGWREVGDLAALIAGILAVFLNIAGVLLLLVRL